MENIQSSWLAAAAESVDSWRRLIDGAVEQLSDDELRQRPAGDLNSVAVILRHLGGNLQSRWTDFLTSDGEKPDRDRDSEFLDWAGDRQSLLEHFDRGWRCLTSAIDQLNETRCDATLIIRGEPHSVPQALWRSITHVACHAGQIVLVARSVHQGPWNWLTVEPGSSQQHNRQTWGTPASRSVFGDGP